MAVEQIEVQDDFPIATDVVQAIFPKELLNFPWTAFTSLWCSRILKLAGKNRFSGKGVKASSVVSALR